MKRNIFYLLFLSSYPFFLLSHCFDNFSVGADDFILIYHALLIPDNLFHLPSINPNARPGVGGVLYLYIKLFQYNFSYWYIANIIFYIIIGILIYELVKQLYNFSEESYIIGFLSSLIFLLLFIHFEIVYYISAGVNYIFPTMFFLFSIITFIEFQRDKKIYKLIISIFSYFIALLFHQFAIVLPVVLIIFILAISKDFKKLKYIIFYFFVPLLYILLLPIVPQSKISLFLIPKFYFIGIKGMLLFSIGLLRHSEDLITIFKSIFLIKILVILQIMFFISLFYLIYYIFRFKKNFFDKYFLFNILFLSVALFPFVLRGDEIMSYVRFFYLASIPFSIILGTFFYKLLNLVKYKIVPAASFVVFLTINIFFLHYIEYHHQERGDDFKNLIGIVNDTLYFRKDTKNIYFISPYMAKNFYETSLQCATKIITKDKVHVSFINENEAKKYICKNQNKSVFYIFDRDRIEEVKIDCREN